MKGMRKFLFMMALVALVATLATATSWAQCAGSTVAAPIVPDAFGNCPPPNNPALNPFQANRTRAGDDGSKLFPAGTVNEPGSMLLYLVNLGKKGDPAPGPTSPRPTNFVSITNVHPTAAVTLHIRYLNADNCLDVLDFLLVLTPNDVFMFNPIDFNIPRPDGTPTGVTAFQALTDTTGKFPGAANYPNSGRFIIFMSATGTFETTANLASCVDTGAPGTVAQPVSQPAFPDAAGRHVANILFPIQVYQNNLACGGSNPKLGFAGVGNGLGGQLTTGRVLTIFNAKHLSFNFLIGAQTSATVVTAGASGVGERRSNGHTAYQRPAVVFDHNFIQASTTASTSDGVANVAFTNLEFDRDGDGPQADFRVLLAGQETLTNVANETSGTITNDNFLRSEIQNGFYTPRLTVNSNVGTLGTTVFARVVWRARGGALAWDRIFPFDDNELAGAVPSKQVLNMMSTEDDYSGDKNVSTNANDRAANLISARTLMFAEVFNNAEVPLSAPPTGVDISPAPGPIGTNLLLVECVSVGQSSDGTITGSLSPNFGEFTLASLFTVFSSARTFLGGPVPSDPVQGNTDLSAGWVRFDRLDQTLTDATSIANEFPRVIFPVIAPGTSATTFFTSDRTFLSPRQGSYLLIGRWNIQFGALGAAQWMHGVSDENQSFSAGGSSPTP